MIKYHKDLTQGTDEWAAARCGLLTASEMKHIITPTLKIAGNEKSRTHLYELLAQRITRYVEPAFVSDAMMRGMTDEFEAIAEYERAYSPVQKVGFITNDKWGFAIGYSPDALVGDDGLVECKSRAQKHQIHTLLEYVPAGKISGDYMIQCQTGLLVTERKWIDLCSYCGGLPMATVRVFPDAAIQAAIVAAATEFESQIEQLHEQYKAVLASGARLIPTVRKIEEQMI